MSTLALNLIEDAKKNNSKTLDLGMCGLTEIPEQVFELTELEELYLCNRYWDYEQQKWIDSSNEGLPNKIKLIPESIKALKKLFTLFAGGDYKYGSWAIQGLNYLSGLENLQILNLRSTNITDIAFLTPLRHLLLLDLSYNKITDITALQSLGQLSILDLRSNNISNIAFLQTLTQLSTLDLSYNKISEITSLQLLKELSILDLSYNNISEIASLQLLKRLTILDISSNKIVDIASLQYLKYLTSLNLSFNKQIRDFSLLQSLFQLTALDLCHNSLSDISFLKSLRKLSILDLSYNQHITDFSFLASLTELTRLNLRSTGVSYISFFKSLTKLYVLDLRSNNISDIAVLRSLTKLTTLDLNYNNIVDITSLKALTQLTKLYLRSNKVTNVAPLQSLKKLTILDLRSNKVIDIASLQFLRHLNSLDLRYNMVVDITSLGPLTQLTTLDLSSNNIVDIASLQSLVQLTTLELSSNDIVDITSLQSLVQLTTLDLSSNKIVDITSLQSLVQLTALNLNTNKISDITVLQSLTQLLILDLRKNEIKGIEFLLGLIGTGIQVKWEYDYENSGIYTAKNPWTTPPVEIVKQGNGAILRYFEELEKSGEISVKEAKLLLTGSGEVGKTSLRYRLKDKKHALPKGDERTRQVDIDSYLFTIEQEDSDFKAHVWDFGGQQIIHHFHRFFMNESALYLLLTETSRENDDFDYWLQTIQLYGKNSPILFVQNKRNGMPRSLDIRPYKQHFNIKDELFNVNLLDNEGLDSLEKAIQYYLQQLPHTQRTIPKSWLRIRTKLEEFKAESGNHFITFQRFIKVCREIGDIDSRKGIEDVGRFLHQLGAVLWYHYNPTLRQKVILERHWATEGIFKLVFDEEIQNASGRFTLEQAQNIWDAFPEYSHHADDLIAMMREFSICYPQRNDPHQYIIPALLPPTQPVVEWQYDNRMVVEYHYQTILPRGLVNYLTAEMYDYIADDNHAWSAGVWLHTEDTQAKIEENRFRRKIRIELSGKQMRELFGVIKKEIDDIHRDYAGVEVELMIPCICEKCSAAAQDKIEYYKYSDVLRRFNHPRQPAINCDVSFEDVSVRELLNNVLLELKPTAEAVPEEGTKIFVSYSHKDLDFRKELENRLKPLLRRKKITELWYDHQIMGGQDWDEEIRHNLNTAEIIILLISDDFWASDYIDSDELPIILERYHNNDCTVIPIVVRKDSYWNGHEISKIQAIPTDAATGKLTPISKWKDVDDAWSVIVQGIQKQL